MVKSFVKWAQGDKDQLMVNVLLTISRSVFVTTQRLLIVCIWIYQKIWGWIQSLEQKSIWNEKSQLHEIDA